MQLRVDEPLAANVGHVTSHVTCHVPYPHSPTSSSSVVVLSVQLQRLFSSPAGGIVSLFFFEYVPRSGYGRLFKHYNGSFHVIGRGRDPNHVDWHVGDETPSTLDMLQPAQPHQCQICTSQPSQPVRARQLSHITRSRLSGSLEIHMTGTTTAGWWPTRYQRGSTPAQQRQCLRALLHMYQCRLPTSPLPHPMLDPANVPFADISPKGSFTIRSHAIITTEFF